MKNKIVLIVLFFTGFALNLKSQSINDVLKIIEGNNREIQVDLKRVESTSMEYRKDNLPDGPEVSYGYFPNNSSVPGVKETFEISQSFQIPCFYRNQSAYSRLMITKDELNHLVLRQDVLNEAKNLLIDYVYLMKQMFVIDKRLKFAEDIYNAYLVRLEVGDANALEINKAKLHLLQVQKREKEARTNIMTVKEKLKNLNGGNELDLTINDYTEESLTELDSVVFEKLATDPEILFNRKTVEASRQHIKVIKNLQLPEFRLGYGSESVADEKFKGFIVGFSIPLWGAKNSIQQVKLESEYYNLNSSAIAESKIMETKIQFEKLKSLQENLNSYETVLNSVNNEELLNKSLELGEISVLEFFTEMFYYYEIYDDFLLVEKEYHQALTDLYRYKL